MLLQKKQVCETFRKTHLDSTRGLGQHVLGHIIHRKASESSGYFETLLDITDKEGNFKGSVLMAGVFNYDSSTNMITDISIDNESLLSLNKSYDEIVLGIEPEASEDEGTSETAE